MPYTLRHGKAGGYDIILRTTGKKVAHAATRAGAIGYMWHAEHGEKKPLQHHGRKNKKKRV